MTLPSFIAFSSAIVGKPIQDQMVVVGDMSLGGNVVPVNGLAETLQMAFDAGGKRVLMPMASVRTSPLSLASYLQSFKSASTPILWMRFSKRWGLCDP